MARYIEANDLVRKMTLQANRSSLGEIVPPSLSYSEMLEIIADAPTADVVPKSEVDKIFEDIYRSVASKIPMEIRPIFKDDRDFDVGFINGKRDALLDVLVLASELKKKYTGEHPDKCKFNPDGVCSYPPDQCDECPAKNDDPYCKGVIG